MEYLFVNYLSTIYPTLVEFKAALRHLDVTVITNDLILDSKPVPYFVVTFQSECPTRWVEMYDTKQLIVSDEYWSYKAL